MLEEESVRVAVRPHGHWIDTHPDIPQTGIDAQRKSHQNADQSQCLVGRVPADPLADPENEDTQGQEADEDADHDDGVEDGGPVALAVDVGAVQHGGALRLVRQGHDGDAAVPLGRVHVDGEGAVLVVVSERRGLVVGEDPARGPRGEGGALLRGGEVDVAAAEVLAGPAHAVVHHAAVGDARARQRLDLDVVALVDDGLRVGAPRARRGRRPHRECHVGAVAARVQHQHQRRRHAAGPQPHGAPRDADGHLQSEHQVHACRRGDVDAERQRAAGAHKHRLRPRRIVDRRHDLARAGLCMDRGGGTEERQAR